MGVTTLLQHQRPSKQVMSQQCPMMVLQRLNTHFRECYNLPHLAFTKKSGSDEHFISRSAVTHLGRRVMKEGGWASANGLPAAAVRGGDRWLQLAVDGASGASAPGRSGFGRSAKPAAACAGATMLHLGLHLAPSSWHGAARLSSSGERAASRALVRDS